MANIWSSISSFINRSIIWCLSSYKSLKNPTSRGSEKVKLLGLLIILSSCTIGEEQSDGVVTIDSTTATTTVTQEVTFEEGVLNFAQCMREEGIDFPDPKPGEFGFFAFRDAGIDFQSEDVQEAFEICQPENPLENLDE